MSLASLKDHYDLVIVGAGFAGMYQLHKARALGLDAVVIDANAEVGGCWYSTRYPGLRCDVESILYSYSFDEAIQQEWVWKDRFSLQEDIAAYCAFVADRLDLRRDIRFNTRVASLDWDEKSRQWQTRTHDGDTVRSRFVVLATGALSVPILPSIEGIDDFAGQMFHTARWPAEVQSFEGRDVAIIGTGSSGAQIAIEAARTARSLTVVQRTVPYVLELQNRALGEGELSEIKRNYKGVRRRAMAEGAGMVFSRLSRRSIDDFTPEELEAEMERAWQEGTSCLSQTFTDTMTNRAGNDKIADFIRRKVAASVADPAKRGRVTPTTRYGAKRLVIANNYYDIFNRENVDAIALGETPIVRIRPDGIETTERFYPVDTLILATGYDAGTGPLKHIHCHGVGGQDLNAALAAKPSAYLGLMSKGFPNLFIVTGPGSPSVLANCVVAIEQHVDFISECLDYMRAHAVTRIEPDADDQEAWFERCNEIAAGTVLMDIDTWYNGANVEGKPKAFMFFAGGLPAYEQKLCQVVNDGYRGFELA